VVDRRFEGDEGRVAWVPSNSFGVILALVPLDGVLYMIYLLTHLFECGLLQEIRRHVLT